jgi:hypothetical protein
VNESRRVYNVEQAGLRGNALVFIREVFGSNLIRDVDVAGRELSYFFSFPSDGCRHNAFK